MLNQNERRKYVRMEFACDLTYKLPGAGEEFAGKCVNLSGAGIKFAGQEPVQPGFALQIRISPDNVLKLELEAFAEVLRCTQTAPREYEIACEIKGIK
ncbi:MAG: PilZ domain-containing protein [Gammaproteobacteria bacterium]